MSNNPPQKQVLQQAARYTAIVCAASFAVMALHFLFLFVFPAIAQFPLVLRRTWGFHFITYYSVPARIEFYLLAAIVCIPVSNKLCLIAAQQVVSVNLRNILSRKKELVFACIAAAAIPLFWLLRSKYAFLGDNFIRVDNVIRNDFLSDEPGAIWFLHYFYALLHSCFSLDGVTVFQVFDCLCGGAFVYLALRMADVLGTALFEKTSLFLFYCAFGTMYHFCGYIEIYSLPVVLLVAYLFTSVLSIKGKLHYTVPALVVAVACACHLISLIFIPSFLVVLYELKLKKYPFFRKPVSWVIIIGVGAALGLLFLHPSMTGRFYPLSAYEKGPMAMFSLVHMWEYCNGLLLSCGPALLIAPACLMYAAETRKRLSPESWFLIIASGCILAGVFAFNEAYGSGDWDIYSFASLPVNIAAMLLFFHCFGARELAPFSRYAVVVFLGFMALHSVPWILINASDKSIKRYEDCIMSDPGSYYIDHPAPMKIAMAFVTYKLPEKTFEYYKLGYDRDSTDPRNKYNYAVSLLREKNQLALSTAILEKLCDEQPGYVPPLQMLLQIAQRTNNADLMLKCGERLVRLYRTRRDMLVPYFSKQEIMGNFRSLVELLLNKKNIRLAEQVCNVLIDIDKVGSENRYLLAEVYLEQGKYDQVISICRILNKYVPQQPEPYFFASTAFQRKNQPDLAVNVLHECLTTVKDEKAHNEAMGMFRQLLQDQQSHGDTATMKK
jgi:tetratricopeptide (TPR) repeat protein